jgi:hypothetical protein
MIVQTTDLGMAKIGANAFPVSPVCAAILGAIKSLEYIDIQRKKSVKSAPKNAIALQIRLTLSNTKTPQMANTAQYDAIK